MANFGLLQKSLTERMDELCMGLLPNGKVVNEENSWPAPALRKIILARLANRLSGFRG